jgi:hypothetical protein
MKTFRRWDSTCPTREKQKTQEEERRMKCATST